MLELKRELTPKTIMLDLLGVAHPQPVTSQQLELIASTFSLPENSLRVALTRLVNKGWVSNAIRGQYHLTDKAQARNAFIRSWRESNKQRAWQGGWVACHFPKGIARNERAKSIQALQWYGFKPGLDLMWVRPDNLVLEHAQLREVLERIGLEHHSHLMNISQVDEALHRQWCDLWPVDKIDLEYKRLIQQLKTSAKKIKSQGSLEETCRLGGEAIHHLVKDPQLPECIHPSTLYEALRQTMIHYDRLGREVWLKQLAQLGVS